MQKEQLAKFQKQIDSAIIGFLNLLDRKELLAKSIDLSSSLSKLNSSIQRSILTIQDTLHVKPLARFYLLCLAQKSLLG